MNDPKLDLPAGPVRIVDSHTAGEPTRVVIEGGPDLGSGSLAERCALLCGGYDSFRSAVINEPRGSDVLVGALLVQPVDPTCTAGVIFFNNIGGIGMCGHGTIGVIARWPTWAGSDGGRIGWKRRSAWSLAITRAAARWPSRMSRAIATRSA